jgi:hypothetical protein
MAQSRKNQPVALRFGPVCKAAVLCVFIVVSCVGYVWQKRQIGELSKQYLEKDAYLKKLREENVKLRNQLVILRSPQVLDQRVKELKLGLGLPQAAQVWRLPEPAAQAAVSAAVPQTKAGLTGSLALR